MVRRVHEAPADRDHHDDDRDLGDDDQAVDQRRLLRAAHEQQRQQEQDEHRGDVHDAVHAVHRLERRVAPLIRHVHPDVLEHLVEVLAPRDGDRGRADRVLEHQIPPDDPGDQLAHRHVRIRVRAAGDRDHRRELGVAESGEGAADARDDERERHRRAGAFGDRRRGAHEQARADDGADAERDEREGTERSLEAAPPPRIALSAMRRSIDFVRNSEPATLFPL